MAKAPFVTEKDKEAFWHSTSHILADAVKRLWPDVKLGIGPAIDEGFYYDFDKKVPFTEADLVKIEAEMKKVVKEDKLFKQTFMTRKEAEKLLAKEPLKLELLNEIEDKKIEFHQHGNFIDLCNNTLVKSAGQVKAFRLLNTAAAYWRGDSKKPVLQRIYGISFPEKEMLDKWLALKAELEKRDHRKIGKQLKLFHLSEEVGPGLPLWLPNGEVVRQILINYTHDLKVKHGYKYVFTPHITKSDLFVASGHLPYYKDDMYPPMKYENSEYYLKPMNCPHHHMIYKQVVTSYRDLPLRLAEDGTVYRKEASGAAYGLMRVRALTQNDSHIYCTREQAKDEFVKVIELFRRIYSAIGIKDFWFRLSLPDFKNKAKFGGDLKDWQWAAKQIRDAAKAAKLELREVEGEAAFYGPKIDVQVKNVLGHEESIATAQLDILVAKRMNLTYTNEENQLAYPVIIHHAILGSFERVMAFLIENYAGAFPAWLAPVQVKLLTFTDRNQKYAEKIEKELVAAGLRVETDYENNTVEYKVRQAEMEKVPAILVCGDKEEKLGTVAVRWRGTSKVKYGVKVEDFIREIRELIEKRM
jgi:threonyl-tRNA synthetase